MTQPRRLRASLAMSAAAVLLAAACGERTDSTTGVRAPARAELAGMNPNQAALARGGPRFAASGGGGVGTAAVDLPAIIGNGTVQLGINPAAHLNVPGGTESNGTSSTTDVGVRYLPTGSEATAPGCLCEGWGAGDAGTGLTGYANVSVDSGVRNLQVDSFTKTDSTAVSVVRVFHSGSSPSDPENVRLPLQVTHDFHPSPATRNLYEVTVTLKNLSPATMTDVRYRRVMDWDIAPNTFSEYVDIQGTQTAGGAYRGNVLYASDNGFETANPLGGRSSINATGDFVNSGATDHGALFDFGFGALAPGESKTFRIFYGAAGSQSQATLAVSQAGAEVYSFGKANIDYASGSTTACAPWTPAPGVDAPTGTCGTTTGQPHTFIFAFASVGAAPVVRPIDVTLNIQPKPILLRSTSFVYVYVPSTSTFDATKIVPGSATLGNESDPEARIFGGTSNPTYQVLDYNRDGLRDMMLVFRRTDLQASGDLTASTTSLAMRASHQTLGLIRAAGPISVLP